MAASIQTKQGRNLIKASLILSSIDGQVQAALYMPILVLIIQTFNDPAAINLSFSITSGVMVVVIFIAGHLAKIVDKRDLMVVGTIIFILGGFCGSFAPNAETLIVTRAIEGVGAGLVYPMVPAITAQLFQGRERTQVMGLLNGGACIIAFFLNFGAGAIGALFGWRACLYIYAILFVAVFLQLKYIPKLGPDRNLTVTQGDSDRRHRVPAAVYLLAVANCVFTCCGMVFNMTLSGFVVETGIGTTTVAGAAGSVQTFVGFIVGLLFARIVRRLGRFVPAFTLAALAVCYFGLSQATTPLGVYGSIAFIGLCCGILYPYLNESVARITHVSKVTLGMSYVSMGMLVGNFLCGFFVTFLTAVTGGSYVAIFLIVGTGALAASLVFLIVGVILTIRARGRKRQDSPDGVKRA